MNKSQRETLAAVFRNPTSGTIKWTDIVSLMNALGVETSEREGSRVGFKLNGARIVLHRPHPRKEIGKGAVRSLREFLATAGVLP
jgi:hypothetical protein